MGQSGQEKTEQPTAKKRRDARKEGNIFQSRDIATVLILAGVFSGIRIWIPFTYASKHVTYFLIQTSAWLKFNQIIKIM